MLLTVISFLSLRSTIFSNIFIPCSNNLMPLQFPHSSGSPFCLYMGTISLFFHSSGICSSSQTPFNISCIVSTPLSPKCLIRSIGRPEHPAAFPFFMLSMAFFTSSLDISWTGPSTAGTSPSWRFLHLVGCCNTLSTSLCSLPHLLASPLFGL